MGYLPNYANYPITKINWKIFSHVAWFSINGDGSGNISGLSSNQAKAFTSLAHQNNSKAIICVGGGGAGGQFKSATSASALPRFIANLVAFMQANSFDGIDIDWEDGIVQNQYADLFKGLAAEFAKIEPKPILTVATFMGLANNTAPVAQYIDQVNLMSYYATMTGGDVPVPQQLKAFTDKGVPKSKLGIGYGYDTDNEVDAPNSMGNGPDGNPKDVAAKCQYAIDNGYGGVMIWEIDRAPRACDSATALFVNKDAVAPLARFSSVGNPEMTLVVESGSLRYGLAAPGFVDLGVYDARGSLVRSLARGPQEAGPHTLALSPLRPGAYLIRLATPAGVQSGRFETR
jgi:chitinase